MSDKSSIQMDLQINLDYRFQLHSLHKDYGHIQGPVDLQVDVRILHIFNFVAFRYLLIKFK